MCCCKRKSVAVCEQSVPRRPFADFQSMAVASEARELGAQSVAKHGSTGRGVSVVGAKSGGASCALKIVAGDLVPKVVATQPRLVVPLRPILSDLCKVNGPIWLHEHKNAKPMCGGVFVSLRSTVRFKDAHVRSVLGETLVRLEDITRNVAHNPVPNGRIGWRVRGWRVWIEHDERVEVRHLAEGAYDDGLLLRWIHLAMLELPSATGHIADVRREGYSQWRQAAIEVEGR